MLGPGEEARFLREGAEELRRIAGYSSFLAPGLLRIAQELENRADEFESAGESSGADIQTARVLTRAWPRNPMAAFGVRFGE